VDNFHLLADFPCLAVLKFSQYFLQSVHRQLLPRQPLASVQTAARRTRTLKCGRYKDCVSLFASATVAI
jgi:hypothetical protein